MDRETFYVEKGPKEMHPHGEEINTHGEKTRPPRRDADSGTVPAVRKRRAWRRMVKFKYIYLLILPGIVFFIIFKYIPMFGIAIAFNDYSPTMGIRGFVTAEWIGLQNFRVFFNSLYFTQIIANTLLISLYKIVFGFPAPILFALLLNEVGRSWFKRTMQTVTYLPHFISWVVLAGMMFELLSITSGVVNRQIVAFGGEPVDFLTNPDLFRTIVVVSDIWKETGWGAIIYLAALAGVDPQLYEASVIDGANRFKQTLYVTIPSILPTIVILFILRLGSVLEAGFEQIFILYSPQVYRVGDIIDTYVYREAFLGGRFGFATAVGLFKSLIGLALIVAANRLVKKLGHSGIY